MMTESSHGLAQKCRFVRLFHEKNFATSVLYLFVFSQFQKGQAVRRVQERTDVEMVEKNCNNCKDPESSVLCKTFSEKCRDFLVNPKGLGQRVEIIKLLRVQKTVWQKLIRVRPASTANQCSSFRKHLAAYSHICERIVETPAFRSMHRAAAFTPEYSDADYPSHVLLKRLSNTRGESDTSYAPDFKNTRMQENDYRHNDIGRKETTFAEKVHVMTRTPYLCPTRDFQFISYSPRFLKREGKEAAITRAVEEAEKKYGEGVYTAKNAIVVGFRWGYVVILRAKCPPHA